MPTTQKLKEVVYTLGAPVLVFGVLVPAAQHYMKKLFKSTKGDEKKGNDEQE